MDVCEPGDLAARLRNAELSLQEARAHSASLRLGIVEAERRLGKAMVYVRLIPKRQQQHRTRVAELEEHNQELERVVREAVHEITRLVAMVNARDGWIVRRRRGRKWLRRRGADTPIYAWRRGFDFGE